MKIRIMGNSIRYRLTKKDIANFGKDGFIEEKTEFLNGPSFYYCLQKKEGITRLEASFSNNRISIFVAGNMVTEWTTTDIVGFDNKMAMDDGENLLLLIEKDFVCLDPGLEDQSDHYQNPNAVC
ncbi:MAG: hypothetical protein Q8941_24825 [Bacteroidota bacterium]|nr:hypothetical protein [Bacteroidota bacterium]